MASRKKKVTADQPATAVVLPALASPRPPAAVVATSTGASKPSAAGAKVPASAVASLVPSLPAVSAADYGFRVSAGHGDGVVVANVVGDSYAASGGLRVGDVVQGVCGVRVFTRADFDAATTDRMANGRALVLKCLRDSKSCVVAITPTAKPAAPQTAREPAQPAPPAAKPGSLSARGAADSKKKQASTLIEEKQAEPPQQASPALTSPRGRKLAAAGAAPTPAVAPSQPTAAKPTPPAAKPALPPPPPAQPQVAVAKKATAAPAAAAVKLAVKVQTGRRRSTHEDEEVEEEGFEGAAPTAAQKVAAAALVAAMAAIKAADEEAATKKGAGSKAKPTKPAAAASPAASSKAASVPAAAPTKAASTKKQSAAASTSAPAPPAAAASLKSPRPAATVTSVPAPPATKPTASSLASPRQVKSVATSAPTSSAAATSTKKAAALAAVPAAATKPAAAPAPTKSPVVTSPTATTKTTPAPTPASAATVVPAPLSSNPASPKSSRKIVVAASAASAAVAATTASDASSPAKPSVSYAQARAAANKKKTTPPTTAASPQKTVEPVAAEVPAEAITSRKAAIPKQLPRGAKSGKGETAPTPTEAPTAAASNTTPRVKKAKPASSAPKDDHSAFKSAFLVLSDVKTAEQLPPKKKPAPKVSPQKAATVQSDPVVASVAASAAASASASKVGSPAAPKRALVSRVADDEEEDEATVLVAKIDSRADSVRAIVADAAVIEKNARDLEPKKAAAAPAPIGSGKKKAALPAKPVKKAAAKVAKVRDDAKEDDAPTPAELPVEEAEPISTPAPASPVVAPVSFSAPVFVAAQASPKEKGSIASLRLQSWEPNPETLARQRTERDAQVRQIQQKRRRSMDFSLADGSMLAFANQQKQDEDARRAAEAEALSTLQSQKSDIDAARTKLKQARRYVGIEIVDAPAAPAKAAASSDPDALPPQDGVKVVEVKAGSAAAAARLLPGEVIVSINGIDTPSRAQFGRALKSVAIGDRATVLVRSPTKKKKGAASTGATPPGEMRTIELQVGSSDLDAGEVASLKKLLQDEAIVSSSLQQLKGRQVENASERVQAAAVQLSEVQAEVFVSVTDQKIEYSQLEKVAGGSSEIERWRKLKVHLGFELLDGRLPGSNPRAASAAVAGGEQVPTGAMRVSKVYPDECADRAGIRVNDLIIIVNGFPTTCRADFDRLIRGDPPGPNAKAKPIRPGDYATLVLLRPPAAPAAPSGSTKKSPRISVTAATAMQHLEVTLQVGTHGMPLAEMLELRAKVEMLLLARTQLEERQMRLTAEMQLAKDEARAARVKGVQTPLIEDTTPADNEEGVPVTTTDSSPASPTRSVVATPAATLAKPVLSTSSPSSLRKKRMPRPSIVPEMSDEDRQPAPDSKPESAAAIAEEDE